MDVVVSNFFEGTLLVVSSRFHRKAMFMQEVFVVCLLRVICIYMYLLKKQQQQHNLVYERTSQVFQVIVYWGLRLFFSK